MSAQQIPVKMVETARSTQQRTRTINVRVQVDTREVIVQQVSVLETVLLPLHLCILYVYHSYLKRAGSIQKRIISIVQWVLSFHCW